MEFEAALEIARLSRGVPREALRLFELARDLAVVSDRKRISLSEIREIRERLEIDENGLRKEERAILDLLVDRGKPIGIGAMAEILGIAADSIQALYEPWLLRSGLIERTETGRVATEKARALRSRVPAGGNGASPAGGDPPPRPYRIPILTQFRFGRSSPPREGRGLPRPTCASGRPRRHPARIRALSLGTRVLTSRRVPESSVFAPAAPRLFAILAQRQGISRSHILDCWAIAVWKPLVSPYLTTLSRNIHAIFIIHKALPRIVLQNKMAGFQNPLRIGKPPPAVRSRSRPGSAWSHQRRQEIAAGSGSRSARDNRAYEFAALGTESARRQPRGDIVRRFRPDRIILFGSHARGEGNADSDVDLLVVMPFSGPAHQKAVEIGVALHRFRVPKDIVVVRPEDFEWRKEIPGTTERPAALEGKVVYAKT